jgi:hypothetical protein
MLTPVTNVVNATSADGGSEIVHTRTPPTADPSPTDVEMMRHAIKEAQIGFEEGQSFFSTPSIMHRETRGLLGWLPPNAFALA